MAAGTVWGLAALGDGARAASGEPGEPSGHEPALTTDRLDEMFQHCADLGVDVEWTSDFDEKRRRGEYQHDADVIVLSNKLTRAQITATLAHELGHRKFGDTCSNPVNERRAWEYGAAFWISPGEYQRAEAHAGSHAGALALELGVTPKLVEAWRRWWLTRGQHRVRRAHGPD